MTFPDGIYDYGGLNSYLQAETGFVDPEAADKKPILTLRLNLTIFRVIINAKANYGLDFSSSNFADLIGFEKKTFGSNYASTLTGSKIPNIT